MDILQRAEEHYRAELSMMEASGDKRVILVRSCLPWKMDALGRARQETEHHASLVASSLDNGRIRAYTPAGLSLKWIEGVDQMQSCFLAALTTSDGTPWSDFEEALRTAWSDNRVSMRLAARGPWTHGVASRPEALALHFRTYDPWADRFWQQGSQKAGKALDEGWVEAFASGRIFAFREGRAGWETIAPHRWNSGAQVHGPSVARLIRSWRMDLHSQLVREQSERRFRTHLGIPTVGDHLANEIGKIELLTADLAGSEEPMKEDDRRYAFLLSKDLATELHHQAPKSAETSVPVTAAKRGRARISGDEQLVQDIVADLKKGMFEGGVQRAVESYYRDEPDRLEMRGSSVDSALQRVAAKVRKAVRGTPF